MRSPTTLALILVAAVVAGCGRSGCQSDDPTSAPTTATKDDGRPAARGPSVAIAVTMPGASPEEANQLLAAPLLSAINSMRGLAHVHTRAIEGSARLVVELEPNTDVYAARVELMERLTRARAMLPEASDPPVLGALSGAIALRYVLGSDRLSATELRRLNDEQVVAALLQLPGTSEVSSCGGAEAVVHIDVDPARLSAVGLSLDDVLEATSGVRRGELLGQQAPVEELGALVIRSGELPVRLSDVATIRRDARLPPCTASGPGGAPVVIGFLFVRGGEDLRAVSERAKEQLAAIELPAGVRVDVLPDRAATVVLAAPPGAADRRAEAELAVSRTIHAALPDDVGSILISGDTSVAPPGTSALVVPDPSAVPRVVHALEQAPGIAIVAVEGADTAGLSLPLLVLGDDPANRAGAAVAAARRLSDVTGAWSPPAAGTPTLTIETDREAAARLGISVRDISLAVEAATTGVRAGATGPYGPEVRVRLVPPSGDIGRVLVQTPSGAVPLSQVATIVQSLAPSVVLTRDGRRVWPLVLRLAPGASPKAVRAELEAAPELDGAPLLRSSTNCSSPAAGCW